MRMDGEPYRRRLLLSDPRMAPLAGYAAGLRRPGVEVPDFDPLDGGVGARALFLLEKPGPMTSTSGPIGRRVGSGFISRDNDDPTAEATHVFMQRADLSREETIIWNVVPWWNGMRAIGRDELRQGVEQVHHLIGLLPNLRASSWSGGARNALDPTCRKRGSRSYSRIIRRHWSGLVGRIGGAPLLPSGPKSISFSNSPEEAHHRRG